MKVAAFELEGWEREAFERLREDGCDVETTPDPLRAENVERYRDVEVISTFMNSRLNAEVLGKLANLKLIATRSTGFDHIDLDHCRERGIVVSNVPSYGKNTVAEHTFGLLLMISKRLEEAVDRTRKGDFSFQGLQGFDLMDKTLGVIGTGDIGRGTIRIAGGFGMKVIAFDVKPDEEAARDLGFEYVELDRLLRESDIISLHVPANPQTKDLLGRAEFEKMKHGAVLLNTSRGSVVTIEAMVQALASGKLRAAGLDVLPEEPVIREEAELLRSVYQERYDVRTLLADHVVSQLRNVVVTPHNAFNTREAVQRILNTTIANIEGFAKGEPANTVGGTG